MAVAAAPWGVSLGAHAVVVLVAAGVWWGRAEHGEAKSVSISFGDARPTEETRAADRARPQDAEPAPLPIAAAPKVALPAPEFATLAPVEAASVSLGEAFVEPEPADASASLGLDAPPPEFFGARGEREAKRVVYVIDASGSMVAAMERVIAELRGSIERLSSECYVQALVFKEGGFVTAPGIEADRLPRATEATKRGLIRWLGAVRADGRGDPLPALERALKYQPDVVFLVSKGLGGASLSDSAARERLTSAMARLERLNPAKPDGRRPVSIKVIQFFETDPMGLMREIGMTHGGEDGYQFKSRKDLNLE